jgi:hypothetical protein
MRSSVAGLLFLAATSGAACAQDDVPPGGCGEAVAVATHGGSTTRYPLDRGDGPPSHAVPITLMLLVGGGGDLALDECGCPRALSRNSLIRMRPFFHAAGFATALVDAPSDWRGEDGLAGFRTAPTHAIAALASRMISSRRRRSFAAGIIRFVGGGAY